MTAMSLPFGRLLTAMVTPFTPDAALDTAAAQSLAVHLVDDLGHDGLVISGTTGEAPTTSDAEKAELLRAVVAAVGDRASIVAGVGTFNTHHSIELAKQAADAGVDGLLVVAPYYSRPTQDGVVAHVEAVAEATPLPILLYDIPKRSGICFESASLETLAQIDTVVGVKDAKGDVVSSSTVIARTGLAYYSGDDGMTLPLLSVGGVGVVGTGTHFSGARMAELIAAFVAGDSARALELNRQILPVSTGVFAAPGPAMVKAALARRGRPVGGLRLPMTTPPAELVDAFVAQLDAAGL